MSPMSRSKASLLTSFLATSALAVAGLMPATAAEIAPSDDPFDGIDVITVVGTARSANEIAGSVTLLTPEMLARQAYTDINRILRAVPGVNLQEEEGYGLRPNIGLRGSGSDRSSKVLIMEDGVLQAPAPYAAPAAYYFPISARMSAVEITKGPGTVKYGPNTTAGAIHFFSTPIPDEASARATIFVTDLDRSIIHGWAGSKFETASLPFDVGYLVETYQDNADGFLKIERGETGFSLADYVVKLGLYSKAGAKHNQSLIFKYQHKDETSDQTYLGLSQNDFEIRPFARYAASQLDQMNNDHDTYQATHAIELSKNTRVTTIAYRTEFARNWEKLDRFDNSALSGSSACNSLDEILDDPLTCDQEFLVLAGPDGFTSPDDVLGIRQNNRSYYAQGIQSAVAHDFDLGNIHHSLTASLRYHEDEVDRFQEQDQYAMDNGVVIKTTDNAPGTQANRLSGAEAFSVYLDDRISFGDWKMTAGVRVEDVETQQTKWSGADRIDADITRQRSNSYTEILPSISVLYDATDQLTLLAGAHKGFAAASVGSKEDQDPEEAVIYEAGGRYNGDNAAVEIIGFFNDYSNLTGECTNSTGGSECDIGDSFNAGEVDVYGIEIVASLDLAIGTAWEMPVSLAYTNTNSNIRSTFDSGFFGQVAAGDELAYVPEHQLNLTLGLAKGAWRIDSSANYVSETRSQAGQGSIPANQLIAARTIVDLTASYELREGVMLRVKAENLFDETYAAARQPYGLRPGKPREIFAGVTLDF